MSIPRNDAAHLLRRAGFGGSPAEVDALASAPTWAAAVEQVLETSANPPVVRPAAFTTSTDDWEQWVAAHNWWIDRMCDTPTPIVEKLTLFWHGHFVSSTDKVRAIAMFDQVDQYRATCLGDFHDLAQAMAVSPAMLVYLDNQYNSAGEPNENFARELMELFTMGNKTFAESDVIAMARAWTGHGMDSDSTVYEFHPDDHDSGTKTLFGITRNWDGPAAITEILRGSQQQLSAHFIARKLYSFLAAPNPPSALVDDLAAAFIAANLNIKALVRAIFLRPEFLDPTTRTALVRSPVEWIVASLRSVNLRSADVDPEWFTEGMGQVLFAPPNVAGWRQNAYWISTSSMWARGAFADYVRWKASDAGFFAGIDALGATEAVQKAFDTFGITEPSAATRKAIEHYVGAEKFWGRSWALQPNLVALAMLSPDMALA